MSDKSSHILHKGEVVNDTYKVQCFVGQGAFGEVYRVEHRFLGLQVLKVFKNAYVKNTDLDVVTNEAKILSGLIHKNIVRVFDTNSFTANHKKHYFMTMGFVSGESLSQLLKREISLSVPVSLSIQNAILQGLNEVHMQDPPIVHRDISPDNILLSYDQETPRALLSDFGLAQSLDQMGQISSAAGKLLYFAPECFWDAYLPTSDVFSAGIVFYRMLTGSFPWDYDFDLVGVGQYEKDKISVMITKARKDAPRSPSEFNPSCSKNLDRIALKAIQKDLELRYRNAGEFLDELSEEFTEMKKKDVSASALDTLYF
jgi:serine/threonine protein kinase